MATRSPSTQLSFPGRINARTQHKSTRRCWFSHRRCSLAAVMEPPTDCGPPVVSPRSAALLRRLLANPPPPLPQPFLYVRRSSPAPTWCLDPPLKSLSSLRRRRRSRVELRLRRGPVSRRLRLPARRAAEQARPHQAVLPAASLFSVSQLCLSLQIDGKHAKKQATGI